MKARIEIDHSSLDEVGLTVEQFQEAVSTAISKLNCPLTGNSIYFNGVVVSVDVLRPSSLSASELAVACLEATKPMSEQDMKDRIDLLADEMDANDEENRFMQIEIDALYAKIDAAKIVTN